MSRAIRGSCLCGGVQFEILGTPLTMAYCHCSRCRKAGGIANVTVRAQDFRWIRGRELVTRYEPQAPFKLLRCFCRVCGTYLGEPETHPKAFPISAHALDDDPQIRPVLHEYVSGKAPWYDICDGLPQYAEAPPLAAFFQSAQRNEGFGLTSVTEELIRKVDCVSLPVSDLEEALSFYQGTLGHQLLWRSETAAGLRMPDTDAELVVHTEARPQATELLVSSVPRAVERFVSAGGALRAGPFEIAMGRCAVVSDPWGNVLVLLDMSKGPLKTDSTGNVLG